MTDARPIRLQTSAFRRGTDPIKLKRGGQGKQGSSGGGGLRGRMRQPVRAFRNYQRPSKRGGDYLHLPWPSQGLPIWDPTDPFIVEFRKARDAVSTS